MCIRDSHVPNEEQLQQAYEALGVKGVEWA